MVPPCKFFFQAAEYKDKEPDALDLFKMCHYSNKKKGYTPTVQSSIVRQPSNVLRLLLRDAFFFEISCDHKPVF